MASLPQVMQPTQSDPLAQLRDIHLPLPIDDSSLAFGWWILAAIICAALAGLVKVIFDRWRKNRYRKAGVLALEKCLAGYHSDKQKDSYLMNFSAIMKRVALTRYPRESVASLTGEAWVDFLDKTFQGREFSMGVGQILMDGPYQIGLKPDVRKADAHKTEAQEFDIQALHRLGVKWIRQHKKLGDKKLGDWQKLGDRHVSTDKLGDRHVSTDKLGDRHVSTSGGPE